MSDRHQIVNDSMFWLSLEYAFPDSVKTIDGTEMNGLWCDGFLRDNAEDTKYGVDVIGRAWIVQGQKLWMDCAFAAHVSQKQLYRTVDSFCFHIDAFDPKEKYIELTIYANEAQAKLDGIGEVITVTVPRSVSPDPL